MSSTEPSGTPVGTSTTAGRRGRPAHAEQDGAGLLGHADRGVALRTQQGQHGQLGVGLGVGQQGGQPAHPALGGQHLAARRDRGLAVDGPDQGAALARDEPLRHLDDPHQVPQTRLGRHGRFQRPVGQFVAGHPDHDLFRPDGLGRERGPAEDQVGRPHQQHLVLEAAGLTFGGVDHHDRRLVLLVRGVDDRLQLAGERERRTAVAAQVDLVAHGHDVGVRQPRQPSEQIPVGLQVQPRVAVEPGRQPGGPDPHDRRGGRSRRTRVHPGVGGHRRSSPP